MSSETKPRMLYCAHRGFRDNIISQPHQHNENEERVTIDQIHVDGMVNLRHQITRYSAEIVSEYSYATSTVVSNGGYRDQ